MYGFGVEGELGEPQGQETKEPAWFRSRMDKVSSEIAELKAENDRLKADAAKQTVREQLTAQGYAPQVADLYTGKPEGLNDWLTANAAALAKVDGTAVQQGQEGVQGTPQTVVSSESQAAQAAFAAAGTDAAAAALGGEEQLVARMNTATTEEEFMAVLREAGNKFVR